MTESINLVCPLCSGLSAFFAESRGRDYYKCQNCHGVFMDRAQLPGPAEEEGRYREHNNQVDDPRYQDFVRPIVSAVLADFSAAQQGLDFGAGTAPVITKMLRDAGYHIRSYDPYFQNFPQLLTEHYDYIACCEVAEHFYQPAREFGVLKGLLNPGGGLYCMTVLYDETLYFEDWYYKNDQTHVFFYHAQSIEWIKVHFGFQSFEIKGRLITLRA